MSTGVQNARGQDGDVLPFFDGATLSIGLNFYQGDLDSNPNDALLPLLAGGNVNLMAAVDRELGYGFSAGLSLSYDRFTGENSAAVFSNNAFALAAEGFYRLPVLPGRPVQVFAGAGPALLSPNYYDFPDPAQDGYRRLGTRFAFFAPVGVVLWDRLRVGVKVAFTDYLDGYRGFGGAEDRDVLTFFNLGYRFGV